MAQGSDGSFGIASAMSVRRWPALTRYLALMLVIPLLAVACGGGSDDDGGDTAGGASPGGDGEPVELTVWFAREYFVPPQEHLDRFEEENPNISLNVDVQPADDLFQQLIRMNDAGQELPDIVHLDGFLRPAVAEAGVVVPIDEIRTQIEENAPDMYSSISDAVWEEGMWDGELVGMATTASMEEVYYRTDWLTDAGIEGLDEGPQSWDEVLEYARAVGEAQPDATPFGWWAVRGSGANHVFASMTAMGVEFDGSIPNLTSEAGEYWIEFIQTLSGEGLMHPEAISWSDDEMRGGYVGGNVGMMLDSVPTSTDLAEAGMTSGEQFDIVPMPTSRSGDEENGVITAPARNFHVTATGEEHMEEAGRFLQFLMEPEVAIDVTLQGGDPPRTSAVLDSEEFRSEYPAWKDQSVEAFESAGVFPVGANYTAAEGVMEQFNQYVVDNPDEDPAAVAEQWQAEFDAVAEGG